jgi:transcriptional regulatory protein LevR
MRKKSLIETNPYLQNSKNYNASLITNVSSSTAIETGENVLSIADKLTEVVNSILIVSPPKQKSTSQ